MPASAEQAIDTVLVEVTPRLTRTALLAAGRTLEFVLERPGEGARLGDVYRARVLRVEPALDAAFVDLGAAGQALLKAADAAADGATGKGIGRRVREGEAVVVQVAVEGWRGKLPRVTRHLDARTQGVAGDGPAPARLGRGLPAALTALAAHPAATVLADGAGLHAGLRSAAAKAGLEAERVALHRGPEGLFEGHGAEAAFEAALAPTVALPEGVTLTIEEGRALAAVDVDSAGAAGRLRAVEANRLAAAAIPAELRRRGIGGTVVVDFIGLRGAGERRAVMDALRLAAADDPLITAVNGLSPLGLAELARRRVRPSLAALLVEPAGRGPTAAAVADALVRRLLAEAGAAAPGRLALAAAPAVLEALADPALGGIVALERAAGRALEMRPEPGRPLPSFDIAPASR